MKKLILTVLALLMLSFGVFAADADEAVIINVDKKVKKFFIFLSFLLFYYSIFFSV